MRCGFIAAAGKIEPNDFGFAQHAQTIKPFGRNIDAAILARRSDEKHRLAANEIHQTGIEFERSGHGLTQINTSKMPVARGLRREKKVDMV
jgi:hypothetical protein